MSKDIYTHILDELAAPYNGITNRITFDKAFRQTLTKEDCEIWLLFPKHTETPASRDSIREKAQRPYFDEAFDHLLSLSFLAEWCKEDGEPRYVRNYLFQIMMAHNVGFEDSLLAIALSDWFNTLRDGAGLRVPMDNPEYRVIPNESALTGDTKYGDIPMNLTIPDTREVVTFDYVSEMVKKARIIIAQSCFCRKSRDWTGNRECDHPVEVCMLFDDLAERTLAMGIGRVITPEEAIEIVQECRERGLMQHISNSKSPSILCNCCSCCCGNFNAYKKKEYVNSKPSRYIIHYESENCISCGQCASICPLPALTYENGKLSVDTSFCVGCGLCVSRCTKA